jgi:hypothetical protein
VDVLDCFLVLHTYFYNTNISHLFDFVNTRLKKTSFYFTVMEIKTQFWHKFLHLIFVVAFFCCKFLIKTVNSVHCCKLLYTFTQYFEFCACICKNYSTICSLSLSTLMQWEAFSLKTLLALDPHSSGSPPFKDTHSNPSPS